MCFWKTKNHGCFSAHYWYVFEILKVRVVPPWNFLGDYTMFKNSCTSRFLFWSILSAITVVFSWYFMQVTRPWSEEESIFSKLQVYENILESLSFSITLKAGFCNNALLQIFSLVESCFIEIRVLPPVTLQKEFLQVRFLSISRTNTLQKCVQTQSNI